MRGAVLESVIARAKELEPDGCPHCQTPVVLRLVLIGRRRGLGRRCGWVTGVSEVIAGPPTTGPGLAGVSHSPSEQLVPPCVQVHSVPLASPTHA